MRRAAVPSLLALAALVACREAAEPPGAGDPLVAPVTASTVVTHRFTETVDGSGTIAAFPEAVRVITSLYAGRVARLAAHVGMTVSPGDPLCEIALDPVGVAEIEKLRRTLGLAERNLERQRQAVAAGVSARILLEQAELDAANARADLQARTRDYDHASQRLVLRAPMAGLVTAVDVGIGQQVDAGTRALTLVDPAALAAEVRFDAAASARITIGQTASVIPLDHSVPPYQATVVRTAPVLDPTSQRSDVWLRYDGGPLAAGTYVRATVAVGAVENPAVPRSALVKTDHGYRVFVLDGGVAHARDVVVGARDGELVAIRDGLTAGEQVASGGAQELADGMRVVIGPQS